MADLGDDAGGTSGAHDSPMRRKLPKDHPNSFTYTDDAWMAVSATLGRPNSDDLRLEIEVKVEEYLGAPAVRETKRRHQSAARTYRGLRESATELLSKLRDAGLHDPMVSVEEMGGDHRVLIHELDALVRWTTGFELVMREHEPHGNSMAAWHEFLRGLCRLWWLSGRPVSRSLTADQEASGAMVDFLVAAAAPVKGLRGAANTKGPMTTEVAAHAIREFQEYLRPQEDDAPLAR